MTRGCAGALVAIALTAGLALRLAKLDVRPMHHDEANQAVKFGALLEGGGYRYDAHDHHGPTLYYLTLPAAWLRGQATLPALDEATLRGVPAVFGAGTLLLLPLMSGGIGRTAVVAGAVLMALSPAMVFYSRMFIQESLFACFTLAFVIAVGRVATGGPRTAPSTSAGSLALASSGGGLAWPALAGVAAGLAAATKETAVIVLPAAVAACAIAWWSLGARRPPAARWGRAIAVSLAAAAATAALFYSSFLTAPGSVLDPIFAAGTYVSRGVDPVSHGQPWHYYLTLLAYSASGGLWWSEALVLALALVGAVTAWRLPRPAGGSHGPARDLAGTSDTPAAEPTDLRAAFWARYLTCNLVIATAIFSAIRYKTPWNLLPFYVGAFALAGVGFSALVQATPSRTLRVAVAVTLALAAGQLGWQAWRAAATYAADPRNPYVYAHTVPDAVRMAVRIRALAAQHPDGSGMQVSVIAPPHEQWPLPWYLRSMPHVGYWATPGDALALQAPVVVASMHHTAALDDALGEGYVSEFFGLRPEVLLALYIERGLWDRFLAAVADAGPGPGDLRRSALLQRGPVTGCGGRSLEAWPHCEPPAAMALWPAASR